MSKRQIYGYGSLVILFVLTLIFTNSEEDHEDFSDTAKIALRKVGNSLLLIDKDSTSLIHPVKELNPTTYELSFESTLSFLPGDLVSVVDSSFTSSEMPKNYRVEVMQCSDKEVAYSYEIKKEKESTIIACASRSLPEQCYTIKIKFLNTKAIVSRRSTLLYVLLFGGFLVLLDFMYRKRKQNDSSSNENSQFSKIGSFHFYPEQNKLVKEATEIALSKKECEILAIFIANPNQIIKRDELTKKVWEDNGVFVGRSLDTYISKLRKKLKDDDAIKLTNVHGVGYKLEVN